MRVSTEMSTEVSTDAHPSCVGRHLVHLRAVPDEQVFTTSVVSRHLGRQNFCHNFSGLTPFVYCLLTNLKKKKVEKNNAPKGIRARDGRR